MKRIDFNAGWTCRCLTRGGEAVPVTIFGEALAVVRADGNGPLKVTVSDDSRAETAVIPCETSEVRI